MKTPSPNVLAVLALLAIGCADGFVGAYFYAGNPFSPAALGALLASTTVVFIWFWADSNARSYRRSPTLSIAVIAIAIVAVPYYLFRSRGLKGGALATGAALLVLIAYRFALYGGELAVHLLRT